MITDGAYGWPMRSSRSRNRSRSSAISMASMEVPRSRVPYRSSRPACATSTARLSAVWPPRPARMPSGSLAFQDALHRRHGERLEIDRVRDARVGHDRGRVGVEQDGPDALLAEGATGLGAGVVELGRLADDHRPRADDEHRCGLGRRRRPRRRGDPRHAGPLIRRPGCGPGTGRTPPPRRAGRAILPGGTGRSRWAACRGAAPRRCRR